MLPRADQAVAGRSRGVFDGEAGLVVRVVRPGQVDLAARGDQGCKAAWRGRWVIAAVKGKDFAGAQRPFIDANIVEIALVAVRCGCPWRFRANSQVQGVGRNRSCHRQGVSLLNTVDIQSEQKSHHK